MQIPFIQRVLPEAKIVPVIMGSPEEKTIRVLAKALTSAVMDKKVLVVASTDMSHQLPQKRANEVDAQTISLITSFNIPVLTKKVGRYENIMCGGGPVTSTLLSALQRGKATVSVLAYGDSSVCAGTARVVGYLSAAITLEAAPPPFSLTAEEKKELLTLARSAISRYVTKKEEISSRTNNQTLSIKRGVFVSLKHQGQFRGCIGILEPVYPLYEAVIKAAISAASSDPRVLSVSPHELSGLEIEISVLSPQKKIEDPKTIEVGKHGLIISKNGRQGVLLPQVPVEQKWDRKRYLEAICQKAGLPPGAWKKGAELFVFEAIVFH
jgi:AmmeMemoRadiSam system protein A